MDEEDEEIRKKRKFFSFAHTEEPEGRLEGYEREGESIFLIGES